MVGKLPWTKALFDMITWAFDKPDAVAVATNAGTAAVTAKPSGGTTGVTGKPTEIE